MPKNLMSLTMLLFLAASAWPQNAPALRQNARDLRRVEELQCEGHQDAVEGAASKRQACRIALLQVDDFHQQVFYK